jgi:hypothetical protein
VTGDRRGSAVIDAAERLTPSPIYANPIDPAWLTERVMTRFWAKTTEDPITGCVLWTAYRRGGYGRFSINGTDYNAHRVAFVWSQQRDVPGDLVLDHLVCDTPRCVNPTHLRVTTNRENILRGESPSARHAVKTHCDNGHELAGDNLAEYGTRRNERQCLTCDRERDRRRDALVAAAHRHCGLTRDAYRAVYGQRRRVAEFVLAIRNRPDPDSNHITKES